MSTILMKAFLSNLEESATSITLLARFSMWFLISASGSLESVMPFSMERPLQLMIA